MKIFWITLAAIEVFALVFILGINAVREIRYRLEQRALRKRTENAEKMSEDGFFCGLDENDNLVELERKEVIPDWNTNFNLSVKDRERLHKAKAQDCDPETILRQIELNQ